MTSLQAFLAGDAPDHVALFLADSYVDDADALVEHGERVDGGVVLVVEGERGQSVFQTATGLEVTAFAQEAAGEPATVDPDLAGGDCPAAENDDGDATEFEASDEDDPGDHYPEFVFAFVEAQDEEIGGMYADGDVVHAYAACTCGQAYTQKWLAGEREA